jgi:hypothetical protein
VAADLGLVAQLVEKGVLAAMGAVVGVPEEGEVAMLQSFGEWCLCESCLESLVDRQMVLMAH